MAKHDGKLPQPDEAKIQGSLEIFAAPSAQAKIPHAVEIRCLSENRRPEVQHFSTDDLQQAAIYAASANRQGMNVYFCPNPIAADIGKPAKDGDIVAATWCFADADTPQGAQSLLSYQVPAPDLLVTTGTMPSLRLHAYWRLDEPVYDLIEWRKLQRAIAAKLGTDPIVVNPSRIMRLPYTVSWPSKKKRARGYVPELVTM